MTRSTSYFAALLCSMSLCVFASEDESDPSDKLYDMLEASFIEEFRTNVVTELLEGGNSVEDAERIFADFSAEVVSCMVAEVHRAIEERGEDPKEVLARIGVENFGNAIPDQEEFIENLEPCALAAVESAGLEP